MENKYFIIGIGKNTEDKTKAISEAVTSAGFEGISAIDLNRPDESIIIETHNPDGSVTSVKYCFDRKTGELRESPFTRSARLIRDLHGD